MSARVHTEAQKSATKRERAGRSDTTKKATRKWKQENLAKVRAYREFEARPNETLSARVQTEAQKSAAKWKRAERSDATKKSSRKWKQETPAKVRAYRKAHPDETLRDNTKSNAAVSIR